MLKDKTRLRLDDLPFLENLENKIAADIGGGDCYVESQFGTDTYFPGESIALLDDQGFLTQYTCMPDIFFGDYWLEL